MSRFSIRPQSFTFGWLGFGRNKAYDDKQSSTRQTLPHKLKTLDPLEAQEKVQSDSEYSAKKAKILIKRMNGVEAKAPATSRTPIAKAISRLGGKAAIVLGLKHRKPQPHTEMLRYANTQPGNSASSPVVEAVSQTPAALHDVIPALVHTLKCEEEHLHAQIDANHASGVNTILSREIERMRTGDDGLALQRQADLNNQIRDLEQELKELTDSLRKEREAVTTATDRLNETQAQLHEATQDLDRALSALEKKIDQQSVEVARLVQDLRTARLYVREAAKTLHFNHNSPMKDLLEPRISDSNKQFKAIRSELGNAHERLLVLQEFRQQLLQYVQTPSDSSTASQADSLQPGNPSLDEDTHEASLLAQHVVQLKRDSSEKLAALQWHQTEARKYEQQLRDKEAKRQQVLDSYTDNETQLCGLYANANELKALRNRLESVVLKPKADVLEKAKTKAQEARAELEGKLRAMLSKRLDDMPGFRIEASGGQAPPALREWADGLEQAVSVLKEKIFKADALLASSVLTLGMQALSQAAGEDPAKAEETLRELRARSLHDLIPPLGDPADASTSMPVLSEAGRTTLSLLASEPRGVQVIAHLLASREAKLSKEQLYAARIYLQADGALHRSPPADESERQYFENAKRAVQHALYGPSVSEGLAAATVDERAAYHGFRNGYQSNAPDSGYQKANQHLQMLAGWQHDAATSGSASKISGHNPFHALREALELANATVLPAPKRRARDEFAKAADRLRDFIVARQKQLPPGQAPSEAELAMQALAEYVQQTPKETDLLTLKLDEAALQSIKQHQHKLQQQFEQRANQSGAEKTQAQPHPGLDATWQALQETVHTLPEAMSLLQRQLLEQRAPLPRQLAKDAADGAAQETEQRCRFHTAVGKAKRLLYDGDPDRAMVGQAFHDLFQDMLGHLEWRDKLRFAEQNVCGANLGPLAAALNLLCLPFGAKMILALQLNKEMVIEFYMGRTGPYMQIGKQKTKQSQAGAGLNGGCLWSLGKKLRMGLGFSADLRIRTESSIEQGVQLRVPRRTKGQDVEIMKQFLDMFKNLQDLVNQPPAGGDWMRELLAKHPNLNVGLIDNAPRKTVSTESNLSGGAALRAFCFSAGATAGLKSKQDAARSNTTVAGNMTTIYKDVTVQTKSELSTRLGIRAQVPLQKDKNKAGASQQTQDQRQQNGLSASFFDLSYTREIRSKGRTHFCTVFTFDGEIDPVRTDRAIDFQSFKDFEREVRSDWDAWVHYGTPKLASQIDEKMRYVVAEKQLENFLEQAHAFARKNKLATMYVDYTLKAESAPILDALRAEASLWRKAGREDLAQKAERDFDDLMIEPVLWEPAILVLREKTKLQVERGIDFFIKAQRNRLADSQRTVGQWVQYEPVERAEPGQTINYVRTWPSEEPEEFLSFNDEASEVAGTSGLNDQDKEMVAALVHSPRMSSGTEPDWETPRASFSENISDMSSDTEPDWKTPRTSFSEDTSERQRE